DDTTGLRLLDLGRQGPLQVGAGLDPGSPALRDRHRGRPNRARGSWARHHPAPARRREGRGAPRAGRSVELVHVLQRSRRQRLGDPGEAADRGVARAPRPARYRSGVTAETDELCFASATWLAEAIRTRRISSLEAVDACLARIEAVNPALNAVVRLTEDARERAGDADAALARGELRGPLHGVPFTIKDSLDTAGVVTTAGSVGWRARVPTADAPVVGRLKAAGGILLGKTNTPEFTWSDETDNDVFGRTSNPYDLERTPGGSSGGAAALAPA